MYVVSFVHWRMSSDLKRTISLLFLFVCLLFSAVTGRNMACIYIKSIAHPKLDEHFVGYRERHAVNRWSHQMTAAWSCLDNWPIIRARLSAVCYNRPCNKCTSQSWPPQPGKTGDISGTKTNVWHWKLSWYAGSWLRFFFGTQISTQQLAI